MFARAALGLCCLAFLLPAAEPEIRPEQMPRVPPTEPDRAASTLILRPGFRAELIAAEPLVTSPVALTVDEHGRAYVVEMRDYSERRPERLGRIRLLEDTDGDGRYDKATVFLDNLPWPTAITCWDGGVFIGATPDLLYAKDTNGDGVADVREVIMTGFASDYAPYATNKLNVQALMNSLQWGPDNRIQGSASLSGGKVSLVDSEFTRAWRGNWMVRLLQLGIPPRAVPAGPVQLRGHDFSFDPRTLDLRAEPGGGQHGMSFDSQGRKFVCSNSDHLQQIAFNDVEAAANPFHELPSPRFSIAADGPAAEVFRRSPDEPWRILRTRWRVAGLVPGPIEGGGRPSGYFTGATGATLYRGDAYGSAFAGDAFIADCGSNLVHRKRLRVGPDGIVLIAERAPDESKSEFLASTDNWFRPVQMYNGPDGCLWIIDMYREVIEHPWSLPENLKSRVDLDSGRERGRLWRIAPEAPGQFSVRSDLARADLKTLVATLGSANGWRSDTAARLLLERSDRQSVPILERALHNPSATGRRRALTTLASVNPHGNLETRSLGAVLSDPDATVRREALRLAAQSPQLILSPKLRAQLQNAASDPEPSVRLAWALYVAPEFGIEAVPRLADLILRGPGLVQSAAIHAARGHETELWNQLTGSREGPTFSTAPIALPELARTLGRIGDTNSIPPLIQATAGWTNQNLGREVSHALASGLLQERHQSWVASLPSPLPEPFAAAWALALNPPKPPAGPKLPPPNPDRLAVVARYLPALDLPGVPSRGAKTFEERCSRCHAIRGIGTSVGPDLASVIANGPARLLVAIADPNREVAPNFIGWTAEPTDGEPVNGLLVRETTSSITLRQPGGLERTLPRASLKSFASDNRSLMPEGLEAGLSQEDMADLLAFLTTPGR